MEYYYSKLFEYIEEMITLPEVDRISIRESFKPVLVPKNTIIETAGEIPGYHNFIVSGYMRNFHHDEDGDEITTDINDGSRFFTSYFHFMNRTTSNENLHCITECELLRISRDDVESRAQVSVTQKDYTIRILQKHLEDEKRRIGDMVNLTAEERYRKFLIEKPTVVRNIPLQFIASYLGMTQRHLSRLRKSL